MKPSSENSQKDMEHLKHSIIDSFGQLFHSFFVAFGVAWATFITGLLTWLDLLGEHAGEIGSLTGALLSLVLIFATIKQHKNKQDIARHEENMLKLEQEKLQLEIDELKRKRNENKE